ncbi:MAG: hypothetical protein JWO59_2321 [Chloroflexi bacterium]|nr:hypothetical protein [Chloroflexota bacterium]
MRTPPASTTTQRSSVLVEPELAVLKPPLSGSHVGLSLISDPVWRVEASFRHDPCHDESAVCFSQGSAMSQLFVA